MLKTLRTAALSAILGLATLAAVPATAQASGASFSFGFGSAGSGFSVHVGPRYGHYHPGYRHHYRRACSERDAVFAARNLGLRDARVVYADHRVVEVRGWSYRYGRSAVTFSRAPHCPVIARR